MKRAESVLVHQIELTEKRLSLDPLMPLFRKSPPITPPSRSAEETEEDVTQGPTIPIPLTITDSTHDPSVTNRGQKAKRAQGHTLAPPHKKRKGQHTQKPNQTIRKHMGRRFSQPNIDKTRSITQVTQVTTEGTLSKPQTYSTNEDILKIMDLRLSLLLNPIMLKLANIESRLDNLEQILSPPSLPLVENAVTSNEVNIAGSHPGCSGSNKVLSVKVPTKVSLTVPTARENKEYGGIAHPTSISAGCPSQGQGMSFSGLPGKSLSNNSQNESRTLSRNGASPNLMKGKSPARDVTLTPAVKLHLPPEATPFTVVVANIPTLPEGNREHWSTPRNKSLHFLNARTGININILYSEFKMARRIGWVGHTRKKVKGDCIVLSLRSLDLVHLILERAGNGLVRQDEPAILPLGYFYPPPFQAPPFNTRNIIRENASVFDNQLRYTIPINNRFDTFHPLDDID